MIKKTIAKKLKRLCDICGRTILVALYTDRTYRGGHYFGKIPLDNGKPAEYWERPKCYWHG